MGPSYGRQVVSQHEDTFQWRFKYESEEILNSVQDHEVGWSVAALCVSPYNQSDSQDSVDRENRGYRFVVRPVLLCRTDSSFPIVLRSAGRDLFEVFPISAEVGHGRCPDDFRPTPAHSGQARCNA